MTIELMFITNDPDIAIEAQKSGVDKIFIDLEQIGKMERQGHLDTVKSFHTLEDISTIREVVDTSELMVRVNPLHEKSEYEIEEVINRGADTVMLPMFKSATEIETFVGYVDGKAKVSLLLETSEALVRIDEILDVEGIDEIHIGLNDLHLSLGVDFMFELLSGGIVEYLCSKIGDKGIKYGFGGIARIGQGQLPAENILAEHYRLGSQMVILSRDFHKRSKNIQELNNNISLSHEIRKLREQEEEIENWKLENFKDNQKEISQIIKKIKL